MRLLLRIVVRHMQARGQRLGLAKELEPSMSSNTVEKVKRLRSQARLANVTQHYNWPALTPDKLVTTGALSIAQPTLVLPVLGIVNQVAATALAPFTPFTV